MKKYLKIWVGSRGGIEECIEVSGDIENEVNDIYNNFAKGDESLDDEERGEWEEYVEEWGCVDKYYWGWFVGLGEEDSMYFIDKDCDEYKKWFSKNNLEDVDFDVWLEDDRLLGDLMNYFSI